MVARKEACPVNYLFCVKQKWRCSKRMILVFSFHTAVIKQVFDSNRKAKMAFRKTNIGIFLKNATDCNFFFGK